MGSEQDEPAVGDEVTWQTHGTTTSGKVEGKVTKRTREAGRVVDASEEDPQYVVRSDRSGKSAAHKPSALRKKPRPA